MGANVTDKFKLKEVSVEGYYMLALEGSYYVAVITEGKGIFSESGNRHTAKAGEQFFITADSENIDLDGSMRLLTALPLLCSGGKLRRSEEKQQP